MIRGVAVAAVLAWSAPAAAFPELALRAGAARCDACHVSPAGGGLINEYGRLESEELSRGGDGAVLHGAVELPGWLLLGGDLRGAALSYQDLAASDGTRWAVFPMQADLRARIGTDALAVVATGGLRGSTRRYRRSAASYAISTEHYALWRASAGNAYVRAGKFFPIQGLRLPDHTLYVRRFTGTNLYEEPYGVAGGVVRDTWELHASAFVSDPLLDVGRAEAGGVVMVENHRGGRAAGATVRGATGDAGTRVMLGGHARVLVGSLALLAEVDVSRDAVAAAAAVNQVAAYLGVDLRLARGVQLAAWVETWHSPLGYGTGRVAAGSAVKLYPRTHWEILVTTRWSRVDGGAVVGLEMLQLHYYL